MFLNRSTSVLAKQCSKYGPNVRAISTTQQCYRGKINIQRPRAPHYERALFNAVTKPIIPQPTLTQECYQKRLEKQFTGVINEKINPYEVIIANEVFDRFNESKMVAIFHVNSASGEEMFKITVALHQKQMHLKTYGQGIMKRAIGGTAYETLLPLFRSKYYIAFCDEANIGELLNIVKKAPQLILLAGIVENRLLSKNELVDLSKLPNLTTARAQFVGVLNSVGSGLVSNLQAHQSNLCNLLDMHAKSKDTESDGTKTDGSVEST